MTKSTPPREAALEAKLRAEVRRRGGKAVKFTPVEAGIPDRIMFLPGGRIEAVELKAEDGKLSPIQLHVHGQLAALGTHVTVLTGWDEMQAWLDDRLPVHIES